MMATKLLFCKLHIFSDDFQMVIKFTLSLLITARCYADAEHGYEIVYVDGLSVRPSVCLSVCL